jgi:predicted secreted hydrolase
MRASRGAALLLVLLLVLLASAGCGDARRDDTGRMSLVATLGGADTAGYARAVRPRPFRFPEDHGPHPAFRTEWWYVTGNLTDGTGRPVGFQLTLFRNALAPALPASSSSWATNQAYMAHLAVTDAERGAFHAFERFARGAESLAGARARPFRVWLEDWALEAAGPGATFPMRLRAAEGGVALDLVLEAGKPPVLQGDEGLSQKGPEPGNASYYYSHTRLPARGTVVLGDDTLTVGGAAWLDREWSTSVLSEGQVGWDWFALQLDDGQELMVYALRLSDGSAHPLSEAVLVDPAGTKRRLRWGTEVVVEALETWTSPHSGVRYPSTWRIQVPDRGWDLQVTPVREDQELNLAFRYWEGAVRVTSNDPERPLTGRGYVELTGYGDAPLPER